MRRRLSEAVTSAELNDALHKIFSQPSSVPDPVGYELMEGGIYRFFDKDGNTTLICGKSFFDQLSLLGRTHR